MQSRHAALIVLVGILSAIVSCAEPTHPQELEAPPPATDKNSADVVQAPPNVEGEVALDFLTRYIYRGRDIYDDRPAFQPWAHLFLNDAFIDLKLMASTCPVGRAKAWIRKYDEVRFTVAFRPRISLFEFGIGHTAYVYYNSDKMAKNTGEVFGDIRANLPLPSKTATASFYLVANYDYDQGNGLYARAGLDASLTAYRNNVLRLELLLGTWIGYDNATHHVQRAISDVDFFTGVKFAAGAFFAAALFHFTLTPEDSINIHDEREYWFAFTIGGHF